MDQVGEKIVFSLDDEQVTAVIQIQFAGDAEDFSWVLPLPSEPVAEGGMEISSEELFVQALSRTNPTFTVNWNGVDQCAPYWGMNMLDFAAETSGDGAGGAEPSVEVLQVKEVGPYTASVLKSNDADALSAWLTENDYDQPPEATPLIAHYVAQEHVFLALKLQQDKGSGDIAPIKVQFSEPEGACIPLILTAIAASEDMPVYAWILDESRVVPKNFFNVGINMAKVDWFDQGSNYIDVVTDAVNEAAGHGFVTEFAGSSDIMKESLYWEGRFDAVSEMAALTHPQDFYNAFVDSGLPANAQTLALLLQFIPVPDYYEGEQMSFYNEIPWNNDHSEYLDQLEFDAVTFVAAIEEVIIAPIMDAQEMLDSNPYMTRIFTTISPDEMDRDPIFVNAPGLGDVSHEHVAEGTGICESGDDGSVITGVQLTLADGTVIDVEGSWSPWDNSPPEEAVSVDGESLDVLASASEISLLGDTGGLRVIAPDMVEFEDNQIDLTASGINPSTEEETTGGETSGTPGATPVPTNNPEDSQAPTLETSIDEESGGCSTQATHQPVVWMFLLMFLALSRRSVAAYQTGQKP